MGLSSEKKEAALAEYLDECQEMLERFSRNLGRIEKADYSSETLAEIYRDMHTIKGSSQLFGFSQIGQLAHGMETCLDPIRKGTAKVSTNLIDTLYAGCDTIANVLLAIREKHQEPDVSDALAGLLARFLSLAEISVLETSPLIQDKVIPAEKITNSELEKSKLSISEGKQLEKSEQKIADVKAPARSPAPQPASGFFGIFDDDEVPAAGAKPVHSAPKEPELKAKTAPEVAAKPEASPRAEASAKASGDEQHSETIRVHVSLLDNLMNLVGELVLIRNQIMLRANSHDEDAEFLKVSQRLNVLTAEMQNEVMKTRMQPIGNILNKFNRVVRDLAKELDKKIELELIGAETELDKTIIEAVKDPLTHIIRNAVDHGIETMEERKKAGKKDSGSLRLKASHESGQVIIEITDDGRGLDREKIGPKAVEKGLLTKETLSKMTEKEVQSLIFSPGFSTASALSNISGRGVGMDVVKTNVEKIGGIVDISSVVGMGTTIKLKIPLTLAIVPALIVWAGGYRFAIPQTKLVELLRIDESEQSHEKLESVQGRPVLRLRGKLLPIVSLSEILLQGNQGSVSAVEACSAGSESNIVILNADGLMFGLIVDAIDDSADIVVKSLSSFLKDLSVYSGATIMGDGSVALTIDVTGIAERCQLLQESSDDELNARDQQDKTKDRIADSAEYLLVDVGATGSYAIPLTLVSRIEEFENSRFEWSGEQKVVRYRNLLLPIFSLPEFLQLPHNSKPLDDDQRKPVVVIQRGDRFYGVEVRGIEDIVEVSSSIDHSIKDRCGILGAITSSERVIVVVDMFGMIDSLRSQVEIEAPGSNEKVKAQAAFAEVISRRRHRILVVEDSTFFRNYIRQVLQEAGFQVEVAGDGLDGFSVLEHASPGTFSVVLSDIEMPRLDGLGLARRVRATKAIAQVPMVAITTRFSVQDIEQGKASGFNRYLEKLNAPELISNLDEMLGISGGEVGRAANG